MDIAAERRRQALELVGVFGGPRRYALRIEEYRTRADFQRVGRIIERVEKLVGEDQRFAAHGRAKAAELAERQSDKGLPVELRDAVQEGSGSQRVIGHSRAFYEHARFAVVQYLVAGAAGHAVHHVGIGVVALGIFGGGAGR
jgi:hypothetical protein